MYESGVQSAKSAGDTSKQKKYGTALKVHYVFLDEMTDTTFVLFSDMNCLMKYAAFMKEGLVLLLILR